jgi:ion channel
VFVAFLINIMLVAIVVVIHYEFLYQLTARMPLLNIKHRLRILLGVFGALLAHAIEVWVFAAAYYLMIANGSWGVLEGNFDGSFWHCVYFSFTTFTTLGFGDIQPIGDIRYLTGVESLTGLVLITWTASFLFIEMQRYWDDDRGPGI